MTINRKSIYARLWMAVMSVGFLAAAGVIVRLTEGKGADALLVLTTLSVVALANTFFVLVPLIDKLYPKEDDSETEPSRAA